MHNTKQQVCRYFSQEYCKFGTNCNFLHTLPSSSFSQKNIPVAPIKSSEISKDSVAPIKSSDISKNYSKTSFFEKRDKINTREDANTIVDKMHILDIKIPSKYRPKSLNNMTSITCFNFSISKNTEHCNTMLLRYDVLTYTKPITISLFTTNTIEFHMTPDCGDIPFVFWPFMDGIRDMSLNAFYNRNFSEIAHAFYLLYSRNKCFIEKFLRCQDLFGDIGKYIQYLFMVESQPLVGYGMKKNLQKKRLRFSCK